MAISYTIQCDGVTTSFTIARAITTKESISLTIASGVSAGTTVSGSDFTFSPVNNTAQSVTITWANAVNYGTVSVPVDVTVAVYHNPGADAADSLLYSYDSASAMRFEMVGRDLEHIIEYLKMVIGGADLATTSLGDQEDDIAALDGRVDAAEATIVTHTSQIAALDTRLDTAESDIVTAQGTADGAVTVNTTQNTRIALLELAAGFVNPLDAADIALADAGNFFPTANVEAALQAIGAGTISSISGKQPLDSDLTAIAALAPSNDDVLQRKAGAWTNRTVAQYIVDLVAAGLTQWAAGGFISLISDVVSADGVSTAIGKAGNLIFQASTHATKFACDHPATGYAYFKTPSGHTWDEYSPMFTCVNPAAGVGLHVRRLNSMTIEATAYNYAGALTDVVINIQIIKVA